MATKVLYQCRLTVLQRYGRLAMFEDFYASLPDEAAAAMEKVMRDLQSQVPGMSMDGALELVCMILLRTGGA